MFFMLMNLYAKVFSHAYKHLLAYKHMFSFLHDRKTNLFDVNMTWKAWGVSISVHYIAFWQDSPLHNVLTDFSVR